MDVFVFLQIVHISDEALAEYICSIFNHVQDWTWSEKLPLITKLKRLLFNLSMDWNLVQECSLIQLKSKNKVKKANHRHIWEQDDTQQKLSLTFTH